MDTIEIERLLPNGEIILDICTLDLKEMRDTLHIVEFYSAECEYEMARDALVTLLRKVVVMRKSASGIPLSRGMVNLANLMRLEEDLQSKYDTLVGCIAYKASRGH